MQYGRVYRLATMVATVCFVGLTGPVAAEDEARTWDLFGDFRVRYEDNTSLGDAAGYGRGVLRFRLGASYRVNRLFSVGARLVTGDPGNPRTADVTIGDFLDDLQLSLDRAYVELDQPGVLATAGKFANPFSTTELVWDADVNPAGLAGSLETRPVAGLIPRFTGIYMIVDEQTIGRDSSMWGAQVQLTRRSPSSWGVELAVAYWDYTISSLVNAEDPGDRRGNLTTPDGSAYLSDFNLADVEVKVDVPWPSASCPLRAAVDFVKNLGAAVPEDSGFRFDLSIGRSWTPKQVEAHYGFARCETDAVLGAFSHDNLPLATNYLNHELKLAYGLLQDTTLSLTWYLFRPLKEDPRFPDLDPASTSSRVRLDLMLRF